MELPISNSQIAGLNAILKGLHSPEGEFTIINHNMSREDEKALDEFLYRNEIASRSGVYLRHLTYVEGHSLHRSGTFDEYWKAKQ